MSSNLEGCVIAAALARADAFDAVGLDARAFGELAHRRVWEAMQRTAAKGLSHNDPVLLMEELGSKFDWGGYISALPWVDNYNPQNLEQYAGLLHEHANLRRLREGLVTAGSNAQDFDDACDQVYNLLDGLAAGANSAKARTLSMADAAREAMAIMRAEAKAGRPGKDARIATGFHSLDEAIGGWEPGNMAIIAGRPGMGKSALVRNISWNAATNGVGVLCLTPEDSHSNLVRRQLSALSGVGVKRLRRAYDLTKQELAALDEAAAQIAKTQDTWLVDGRKWLDSNSMCRLIRRYKASHDIKLVTVDYIQLVIGSGVRDVSDTRANVERATKELVAAASKHDVAVVLVSQLDRSVDKREPPIPQLADLRWSGNLEEQAEIVLFPFRPRYYNERGMNAPGETRIIVGKQKHGGPCEVPIDFDPNTTNFLEKMA